MSDYLYWTDQGTDKLQRSSLNGSGIVDLQTGLDTPKGLDLHIGSGHIYWTDPAASYIRRCDFDGSNTITIASGLANMFQGIAIDEENGYLYTCSDRFYSGTSYTRVARCNLDGSNLTILLSGSSMVVPLGIALDVNNNKFYWTEYGYGPPDYVEDTGYIGWANLDGSSSGILVGNLNRPLAVETDLVNNKLYWTNTKSGSSNIQRSDLDGTNIETLVSGLNRPNGLALDTNNSTMYFTEVILGTISSGSLDGLGIAVVTSGVTNPQWIAVDSLPSSGGSIDDGTIVIAVQTSDEIDTPPNPPTVPTWDVLVSPVECKDIGIDDSCFKVPGSSQHTLDRDSASIPKGGSMRVTLDAQVKDDYSGEGSEVEIIVFAKFRIKKSEE